MQPMVRYRQVRAHRRVGWVRVAENDAVEGAWRVAGKYVACAISARRLLVTTVCKFAVRSCIRIEFELQRDRGGCKVGHVVRTDAGRLTQSNSHLAEVAALRLGDAHPLVCMDGDTLSVPHSCSRLAGVVSRQPR